MPYWLTALQLLLAATALAIIARRLWTFAFVASLDTSAFVAALEAAIEHGQLGLAARIARACLPAWPARLAHAALAARKDGATALEVHAIARELHGAFDDATQASLSSLVALGRIAAPLSFLGIILVLGRAFGEDQGLLALQHGAVERAALEHAALTFSLGFATAALCFSSAMRLRRRADGLREGLRRVLSLLERVVGSGAEV